MSGCGANVGPGPKNPPHLEVGAKGGPANLGVWVVGGRRVRVVRGRVAAVSGAAMEWSRSGAGGGLAARALRPLPGADGGAPRPAPARRGMPVSGTLGWLGLCIEVIDLLSFHSRSVT